MRKQLEDLARAYRMLGGLDVAHDPALRAAEAALAAPDPLEEQLQAALEERRVAIDAYRRLVREKS